MLEIKATLRISSVKYSLEEIKKSLGDPTLGFSIGDSCKNSHRKREFSLWALESTVGLSEGLDAHVEKLVDFLDEKSEEIKHLRETQLDIFCMHSSDNGQGGSSLSSGIIKRMSKYDLDLSFDVYASE